MAAPSLTNPSYEGHEKKECDEEKISSSQVVKSATAEAIKNKSQNNPFGAFRVIRRTGQLVAFDPTKIQDALQKAFTATYANGNGTTKVAISDIVAKVCKALSFRNERENCTTFAIEDIQDQVELALARLGHNEVGSAYSKYREEHAAKRISRVRSLFPNSFTVVMPNGETQPIEPSEIHSRIESACHGLNKRVDHNLLLTRVISSLHEGITLANLNRSMVLEASTLIELHNDYSKVASRLLLDALIVEVMGRQVSRGEMAKFYARHLATMISTGIKAERIDPKMNRTFDLGRLGSAIRPERDDLLDYLGLQTLYDRYFIKDGEQRIELPQTLWMRVAMGLALNEVDPNARAIEFYEVLSTFKFMSSTPTLFNAGTTFSQLSSCYLTTVPDDLYGIYGAIQDNAMLSKFAGGLGNDWTPVRAMGSVIKGTGGKSQGVVPFLRVVNDTAVAVNQGGKRKGAVCGYLESWHGDIEEFQDLRKNTGDERRRAHDMNTANWVPDLFMKRIKAGGRWILFSPKDVPDLHELYGRKFQKAYEAYEKKFDAGEIKGKEVEAFSLWQRMIRMVFETGHPWITYKDPCNIRSPQQHAGVVHSSNLCTEITLNTNDKEIAVCNLGSINLGRHLDVEKGELDKKQVKETVTVAMRMLDNVIDINYYAVDKAAFSNDQHRPVGLGQVGFQDCLNQLGIGYDTEEAIQFADRSTEVIAYEAYWASSDLAAERAPYKSFEGSTWSQGKLPLDTLYDLATERSDQKEIKAKNGWIKVDDLEVNVESTLDWDALRDKIKKDGMRNSNCLAIAPTATISNIMGTSPCIEPVYKNLFVKSNLSGEFKVINKHLVKDLIKADLWDDQMLSEIKQSDGEIADIARIPQEIRSRHKTCFQLDQKYLIEAASRRQKWIDQSQSLNLFFAGDSGKDLSDLYMFAWLRGLKTTYYCRTQQASSTEKYTTESTGNLNNVAVPTKSEPKICSLEDPDCESCQ